MGIFDIFRRKEKREKEEVKETEEAEEPHICALCGQEIKPGEGKYYGGQWWHKKCLRKARKMAKSMI